MRWRAVWRLKRQGHGQREIARMLEIRLASVQWYLKKGRPPPVERMKVTRTDERFGPPEPGTDQLLTKARKPPGEPLVSSRSAARGAKGSSRSRPRVASVTSLDAWRRKSG